MCCAVHLSTSFTDDGATCLTHLRSGRIDIVSWRLGSGGTVLEETLLLAGTCRRPQETLLQRLLGLRGKRSQDTVEPKTQSGLILLFLLVSTFRDCCSELFSVRDTFLLSTRPRSDGRSACVSPRRVSKKSGRVCWPRIRLWYRPKLQTKKTRPPDCPPKKQRLKQLQV